ncbi:MAG: hypothetical protein INR73_02845 [Williamsia sp.]|nr:hypothetical protein [Williamsia sp.]
MAEKINFEELSFDDKLSRLEAETRIDPIISKTADFLFQASLFDSERSVLQEATQKLTREDPRELYLAFLKDCVEILKKTADKSQQFRFLKYIESVAIAGLGIWQEDLGIANAGQTTIRFTSEPDWPLIRDHINKTVFGKTFFEKITVPPDQQLWGPEFPLRMSSCDASQHRFKLKVPFRKTIASPVVVNNSGGTIKWKNKGQAQWQHVAVPRDTSEYENWVIIGPEDYAEMEEGDYEWATKSSMDVGQFFIEETFIFKHGGLVNKPDVHFRDGRIFPQDKLMNCVLTNRHGSLTREAMYRMATTCRTANELKILFAGVAKQVELKVYSTLINWYIIRHMGYDRKKWNPTGHIVSDSEIIRHMLYLPGFNASQFNEVLITCPIKRRFHTVSNLNRRTRKQVENDLARLDHVYHTRDLSAREIVNQALKIDVMMFFTGHSTTDEMYFPRYEFLVNEANTKNIYHTIHRLLSALRLAQFDVDEDHLRGLEEPIKTLVPAPILVAHDISKKMGEELSANFAQKTIQEFIKRMKENGNPTF